MSEPSTSPGRHAVEELFHRWCVEHPRATPAALDQLCAQHPRHASSLRRLYAARARGRTLIERLAGAPREPEAPPIELAPADAGPLEPRHDAGRYALEGEVGRGGMGVVLRVRDRELDRPLAMKVARATPEDGSTARRRAARLRAEARVQARLDHPGILPVHELGVGADGALYFTMPLVRGRGLDAILEAHRDGDGEWSTARVTTVLMRVCEAVGYAHHQGVVHRDLKPSNVMVGSFGETYVTDWGLARVRGADDERDLREAEAGSEGSALHTREGDVLGTPAYMPPEQAAGALAAVDERADVYAIGAMLYELLAGARPHGDAPPARVLAAVRAGPPAPLPNTAPEELVSICERAMARDPSERYPAAAELAEDLRAWLEGRVVRAHATGPLAELRKWIARNRLAAAAMAGALLAVVGGLLLYTRAVSRGAEELAASLYRTDVALATAALSGGDTGPLSELLARSPERMRGWEWRYLARLSDSGQPLLRADGASFHSLARSPDGALLAVGDDRGLVRLYDTVAGTLRARFEAVTGPVRELAFTSDGGTLGLSGDDRALRLFDAADGRPHRAGAAVERGYAKLQFDLASDLAAASRYDGGVELYSARGGEPRGVLEGVHEGAPEQVRFLRDGQLAVTSARDGRVAVWSVEDCRCLRSWRAHDAWVRALAASPDERLVATGASDGAAAVWSLETGARVATLPPDSGGVFALAWSADGARLATAGGPSIRLWDTRTWRERARLVGHAARVVGLSFAPDGRALASIGRDGELRRFDLVLAEARAPMPAHAKDVEAALFLAGGARVASADRAGEVALRRFEDGALLARRDAGIGPVHALAAAPDGTRLAAAGTEGRVALLDAEELAPLDGFEHGPRVYELAFLDARHLLVADGEGALALRPVDGAAPRWRRRLSEHPLGDLALDARRDRAVVSALDGALRLVRASTGELLAAADGGEPFGQSLAFAPDGRLLAAGGRRWLSLFALPELELVRRVETMEHSTPIVWLADGSRILAGGVDGSLTLWEPEAGERIAGFPGHREACASLGLSADGRRLVSGALDGTLRLWDARPRALTPPPSSPPR